MSHKNRSVEMNIKTEESPGPEFPCRSLKSESQKLTLISLTMDLGKVLLGVLWVPLHSGSTWGPVCRAHLSVLLSELEGINEPQGLIH